MKKNKNKKLRSCCPQPGRSLRRKQLFRELGQDLLRNPEGKAKLTGFRRKEREQVLPVWEARTFQTRMF
jgi:hypothetical protein